MNKIENDFFEAYKRLEKICIEMYGAEKGVTSYIDDMKDKPLSACRNIPYWESDLKRLKKLRHKRNNLAHANDSLNVEDVTQNDIDWIEDFYNRILNRTDPLYIHYKNSRAGNQIKARNQIKAVNQIKSNNQGNFQQNENDNELAWIVAVIVIIGIIICIAAT